MGASLMYHPWMSLIFSCRAPVCLAFVALAQLACSSRPLDSEGGDAGSGDSSAAPVTDGPPMTSGTTTTATTTTTTATTGPVDPGTTTSTTGPVDPGTTTTGDPPDPSTTSTTSVDPSASSTTDVPDPPDPAEVPEGLWGGGCTKVAPPGTKVEGNSKQDPFLSTRAYFGYTEVNGQVFGVRLLFLDEEADSDVAFKELSENFQVTTGPAADVSPNQEFTARNPFWFGVDHGATFSIVADGKAAQVTALLDITGHKGTWDAVDPADPPRLQGEIQQIPDEAPMSGSFDAVFCDLLSTHIIAE